MGNKQVKELTDRKMRKATEPDSAVYGCIMKGSEYTPQVWVYGGPPCDEGAPLSGPSAIDLGFDLGYAIAHHFGPNPEAVWTARAQLICNVDSVLMHPGYSVDYWQFSRSKEVTDEGRRWFSKHQQKNFLFEYHLYTKEVWIAAWKKGVELAAAKYLPLSGDWGSDKLF